MRPAAHFPSCQCSSLASLLAVIVLAACSDVTPLAPRVAPNANVATRSARRQASYPAEERFVGLAHEIPGFGGYFYGLDGNLHAYLTDVSREKELRKATRDLLDAPRSAISRHGKRARLIVHQGQFDFLQLAGWRDALFHDGQEQLHSIGVDEAANSVRIGVATTGAVQLVSGLATRLGVPAAALRIEVAAPERDLQTLSDLVNPAVGGILITAYQTSQQCALGYNTLGGAYFVTNSHCTRVRGPDGSDPTRFFQPNVSGYYAGFESEDPAYFSSAEDPNCPTTSYVCRWSDAALIQYVASVAPGAQGQGRLARTLYYTDGFTEDGSKDIAGYLTITGEVDYPLGGEDIGKIGPSSGWTDGLVTQTCVNVLSAGGYWYLCQDIVHANASEGDSGSPVFELRGNYTANFYGVLRGWSTQYNGFSFSSFGNISADFGYLPAIQ